MAMEKTGDISDKTPSSRPCCGGGCHTNAMTKEGADQRQASPLNTAIDAVAKRTGENAK